MTEFLKQAWDKWLMDVVIVLWLTAILFIPFWLQILWWNRLTKAIENGTVGRGIPLF